MKTFNIINFHIQFYSYIQAATAVTNDEIDLTATIRSKWAYFINTLVTIRTENDFIWLLNVMGDRHAVTVKHLYNSSVIRNTHERWTRASDS